MTDYQVDPNLSDDRYPQTPLDIARINGLINMLLLLKELGANADEKTIEMTKKNKAHRELMAWYQANTKESARDERALVNEVNLGNAQFVDQMLEHEFFKKQLSASNVLTLNMHLTNYFPDLAKIFRDNSNDMDGNLYSGFSHTNERTTFATPIFQAIINSDAQMVAVLVKHGAKANKPECANMTPLEVAERMGNQEIIGILNGEVSPFAKKIAVSPASPGEKNKNNNDVRLK